MDVRELYDFCRWLERHGTKALEQYQALQRKLNQNATQPQKQPLKDELKELLATLHDMPTHRLSNEQLTLLEQEGVDGYLGKVGEQYVRRIVKSARFDPASANQDFKDVVSALNNTISRISTIKESLSTIDTFTEETSDFEHITIRVHFKDSASISDVAEWKTWSEEWYDIVRGIALCVDEAPENVKVLGAHQGSVIIVLGATAAVTSVLLLISTHLTKIALNGLQVANAVEDLKMKTKLNKTIIDGLEKSIERDEKDGLKNLLAEAKERLPAPINGEQENALKKSIEKYQKFTAKGGEVDFLSPPEPDEDDDLTQEETAQIEDVRENIDQLRDTREETRLLENQQNEDDDFEDEDLEDD